MTAIADEGVSLLTIVGESGRRRLDELGVARVIAEVAEALDQSTVLAQPITPANIVILRTGTVRLDGKSIGPDEEIAYTAPERLRGESGDHRSDVFSLGVVMWEALTHARLFEGLTEDAIKEAVLADEVSAPSTRNANIPAELDVICLRALARDPVSRYPTAKAMAVEVEGVLRDASYGRNNEAIGTFVSALPKELFRKVVPAKASLPAPKVAPKIGTHTMIGIPQPKPPAETVPMPGLNQSVPTVQLAPLSETAPGLVTPMLKPPAEVAKVVESAKGVPALDGRPPPAKSTDTVMGIGRLVEAIPDDPIQPAVDGPAVVLLPAPPILPPSPLVQKKTAKAAKAGEGPHVVPAHIAEAPTQMVAPVSAADLDKPARARSPNEFEDEPSASPVEVPAADNGTGGRDVLAGWAWQTGGQASIDDDDDIAVPPPSRRPLFIAIGGALAVLGIIAIVAFAGGGSRTEDDKPVAKPEVATVQPAPSAKPDPGSAATDPSTAPSPGSGTDPTANGTSTDPTNPSATTATATTTSPTATGTTNPSTTTTPPTTNGTTNPSTTTSTTTNGTNPSTTGTTTATTTSPTTNGTTTPPPPTGTTSRTTSPTTTGTTSPATGATTSTTTTTGEAKKPPEPPKKLDPPKKVDPPKIAKVEPPKKIEAPKKKIEPKPPHVATAPKARPVDPYPEAKPDAEASYRNGVQAFARGDTSAALSSLRSALDANPRFAPTSRALGLVYEKMGERNQAVRAYRRYLQLAPGAGDADQIRTRLERLGS